MCSIYPRTQSLLQDLSQLLVRLIGEICNKIKEKIRNKFVKAHMWAIVCLVAHDMQLEIVDVKKNPFNVSNHI